MESQDQITIDEEDTTPIKPIILFPAKKDNKKRKSEEPTDEDDHPDKRAKTPPKEEEDTKEEEEGPLIIQQPKDVYNQLNYLICPGDVNLVKDAEHGHYEIPFVGLTGEDIASYLLNEIVRIVAKNDQHAPMCDAVVSRTFELTLWDNRVDPFRSHPELGQVKLALNQIGLWHPFEERDPDYRLDRCYFKYFDHQMTDGTIKSWCTMIYKQYRPLTKERIDRADKVVQFYFKEEDSD